MKPRDQTWQDRVYQEANFLPKRLVLITLLLLVLYGIFVIRTEWVLRTSYTGIVEARLVSKLRADYQSTEAPALAFAPLSVALIEAKIRDENPYLSDQAIAPLVQTAMAAAYAPIIAATPTPGPVAYAIIQSVSLVTENTLTAPVASTTAFLTATNRTSMVATADDAMLALVFATPRSATVVATNNLQSNANLALENRPTTTRSISLPPVISSMVFSLPQASTTFDTGIPATKRSPTATAPQRDITLPTPTRMTEMPNLVATQVKPVPTVTMAVPATTLPTEVTTATNEPSTQVALSEPTPMETPTVGASTGSSAALAATSALWPLMTSTPQPTTTPSPIPTETATVLASDSPSLTFVESTSTDTPVVMPIPATATKTTTPSSLPSPTVTLTPLPTITASPTGTPTAIPTVGVPPAIIGLSAYMENNKVYLTWSPSSATGVVGYNLYRSCTSAVGSELPVNPQLLASTSYVDTLTLNGSQCIYVVTAVSQSNQESPPSQAVTITTVDRTPPTLPVNFSVRLIGDTVQLQWQASSAPDLAGYNIYRSNHLPVERTQNALNGATLLLASSYQDRIALNGETYYYVFTAVDFSGNESLPSIEAQIPTVDLEVPAPPTGLTTTFQDNAVLLQWQANAESDIAGYRLYRDRVLPVAEGQPIHSEPLLTALDYRDGNIERGATYFYILVAVDNHKNASRPSEPVLLTVPE